MTQKKSCLHEIQQNSDYQLLIRNQSDKAGQGLLTLLVTVNVGAFVTVIELLENHYWLLTLFCLSTVAALLSRTGVYYIYRYEVNMFDDCDNFEIVASADSKRMLSWKLTEIGAWVSLASLIIGIIALTVLYIQDFS